MHSFWLIVGVVLIGGVAVRVAVARRRQTRALRALAAEWGLSFSTEDLIDVQDRYQNLDLIRQGYSRHACNLLYGPTDVGLVTVFAYHYELGFGGQRVGRDFWFAVVETPGVHGHWRAMTVDVDTDIPGARTRMGRFHVRADHEQTLVELKRAGLEAFLGEAPGDYRFEVRGPLVAVASPFDADIACVRRLLDTARGLARALAGPRLSAVLSATDARGEPTPQET